MEVTKTQDNKVQDINAQLQNLEAKKDEAMQDNLGDFERYLLFELEDEDYGINIEYVIEIIGIQDITYLPKMPNYVKGLINLRGKIVPVIDAREKFGKQKAIYNDRTCIVVLDVEGIMVGLVVDTISDVINVYNDVLEEAPKIGQIKTNKYISNIAKVDDQVKLLIDCDKLINE
jgi:purine-binding chemotaxis protein CheW